MKRKGGEGGEKHVKDYWMMLNYVHHFSFAFYILLRQLFFIFLFFIFLYSNLQIQRMELYYVMMIYSVLFFSFDLNEREGFKLNWWD